MWKQKLFLSGIGLLMLLVGIFCSNPPANPEVDEIDALCDGEKIEIASSLNLNWTLPLQGGVASLPALSGDVIVVEDGWVKLDPFEARTFILGIQPETGQFIWQYPNEGLGFWFKEFSATGGNVSFVRVDKDGTENTVIISAESGKVIPAPSLGEVMPGLRNFVLDMLVTPNYLFLRTSDRSTTVLDITSFQEIDHFPTDEIVSANKQFEYADGLVYSLYGNRLDVIQDAPYQRLFRAMLTRWNQPTSNYSVDFVVHDQQLLVIFSDGLSLYNLENQLIEAWSIHADQFESWNNVWHPAFANNHAYLFDKHGALTGVDLRQGTIFTQKLETDTIKPISTPVFYQGKLYAVYSDGTLRSFSLPNLTEQIEVQSTVVRHYYNEMVDFHVPGVIVAKDKLLVSFGCKNLYAFQTP